ncbi:hypothetical protein ANCDUO_02529 [Ancylostoma duodenale]|uniref:Phlebovirus glycoprotein G2 fusion domain-containing protein n=1 Tax=Ancylostoma duodenale TaxID=51022 RepID=A0A0C2DBH0_9BILA|nr:hypothetical protein ANCDUO_02529 [Ancylostoma duodenale]
MCANVVYGCQQTIIIPTSLPLCTQTENNCSNQQTIIAKLNPMQSELCLQLKHGNQQYHVLKITLQGEVLRCRRGTLYFTRNTEFKVQHRKRCPHMGSCSGLKCANITPNSLVKELDIANNFTGITYCSESCGGLGCSCGYPSSGCLFYRIYHVPVDQTIYEVFDCPTWFETAKVKFQQFRGNGKSPIPHAVELVPRSTKTTGSMKMEITSIVTGPISILTKRFITNGKSIAYLQNEASFNYASSKTHANVTRQKMQLAATANTTM